MAGIGRNVLLLKPRVFPGDVLQSESTSVINVEREARQPFASAGLPTFECFGNSLWTPLM